MVHSPGQRGIAAVHNDFVAQARSNDDCEALVLVHEDVEIIDPLYREKILAVVAEPDVGICGVIGGAGLESIAWWDARARAGRVRVAIRVVEFGSRTDQGIRSPACLDSTD